MRGFREENIFLYPSRFFWLVLELNETDEQEKIRQNLVTHMEEIQGKLNNAKMGETFTLNIISSAKTESGYWE